MILYKSLDLYYLILKLKLYFWLSMFQIFILILHIWFNFVTFDII